MEEIWKDIEEYPNYQVSNFGNIKNKKTNRLLKSKLGRDGRYLSVYLCNNEKENTQRVHRLVAEAFLGKQPGLMVNHIDGNKLNNRVENLEWCTAKDNNLHAIKNGLNRPGAYQKKPIRCIETGEIFEGVVDCANTIGGDFRNVYRSLNSDCHYAVNGLHFEYVPEYQKPKREPFLRDYQTEAVKRMFNGCVLNGTVGSGKSRTGLYYYFQKYGGSIDLNYIPMRHIPKPPDLYILTTAKKRDDKEWELEMIPFRLSTDEKHNMFYGNKVVVDSWQNIKKYDDVRGAFFIFDENKINGKGAWAKSFLKIARYNEWIILSASNGDRWEDYETLFIAEGFFKNRTEFRNEHLVYSNYAKFPKVTGYRNEERLFRLRSRILIDMDFNRTAVQHHEDVYVKYDIAKYKDVVRRRWDVYKDEPITQASSLCYVLRRVVNEDESRQVVLLELLEKHPKAIIFYSYDYELDILLSLWYSPGTEIAQYNGHKHEPVPRSDKWVYLVNYNACEAWNNTSTNTMIFFSQNYSYKVMIQAAGRIDRLNTPYKDLYYYHLKSRSGIDLAISKALANKKKFNERKFVKWD